MTGYSACAEGDSSACIAVKSWRSHAFANASAASEPPLEAPTMAPMTNEPVESTTTGALRVSRRRRRSPSLPLPPGRDSGVR